MEKEHLAKGTLLFHGTYRIEGKLGQGGFGITYLATDVALDKYVAIKEFFPNTYCKRDTSTSRVGVATEGSREFVTKLKLKFLKEARNIAKLDHPNIVRLHAAFEENDTAYYVMDYIEGTPLSQIVKTRGPLDRRKAVEYATLIGNALGYLHKRRINHLDVKPANIMVRKSDGVPVLIDFGLAKQYDCEGQQTTSTPVGFSQGFAPVEQYKPGGVKEFSPASDLYSLAATLYFMLSGRIPPPATDLVDEPLTFPEAFPSDLKKPIEKAMSASRKSRHASVGEFLREINPDRQAPPPSPEEDTTFENTTYEEPAVEATVDDDDDEVIFEPKGYSARTSETPEKSKSNKLFWIALIAVLIVVLFLALPKSCGNNVKVAEDSDSNIATAEAPVAPADAFPEYASGEANGHYYVDLGLPSGTLWATSNVGASEPWEVGDVFNWYGDKVEANGYPDMTNISGTKYDAARKNWGGDWRVPRVEEVAELLDNTDFELTELNGVKGGKFTAKNGNSIFIPCTVVEDDMYALNVWSASNVLDTEYRDAYYLIDCSSDYPLKALSGWNKYVENYRKIREESIYNYMPVRPVMSPNRK